MSIYAVILLVAQIIIITLGITNATKYDIHIFQLNSYRYRRYMRWLFPANILTHNKWALFTAFILSFVPGIEWAPLILVAYFAWKEIISKYKTPIVFTKRVIRLYTTVLLLYISVIGITIMTCPDCTLNTTLGLLAFSNIMMLLANIVNTPMEKAINHRFYREAKKIIDENKNLIVIGVTGSFGKTSTKNYLASLLAEKYNILVTPGNYNTLLGVVRTIREQLRPYHQIFIVEMGAKQPGDIKEICDLVHPEIGIVTAVGEMHLETFKSVENIQKTKFELINALPDNGLGIINVDSQYARDFKGISSKCKIKKYAINEKADIKAEEVEYGAGGVSFTLSTNKERYDSLLLGSGNLLNILASITVAEHLQIPVQKQKNAIARLQSVEHRLSMRRSNGITILDDAYNSNPNGAKMALEVLKNFTLSKENRRIVITPGFVEMGVRQFEANKELGNNIALCSDYAIIVNATNREAIKSGLEQQGFTGEKYFLADSLNQAHAHLATIIKTGDIVLYENDLPDNFK